MESAITIIPQVLVLLLRTNPPHTPPKTIRIPKTAPKIKYQTAKAVGPKLSQNLIATGGRKSERKFI